MQATTFVIINLNGNPKQQSRVENVSALELKLLAQLHGAENIYQIGSVSEKKGGLTFGKEVEKLRLKYKDAVVDKFLEKNNIVDSFSQKIDAEDYKSAINNATDSADNLAKDKEIAELKAALAKAEASKTENK